MTRRFDSAAELARSIIDVVGMNVVLGLPVGIGKAIRVADALFERAATDTGITLTIFTGLTLETPRAGSDVERRFLEPLAERLYGDWPTPKYAQALRDRALPDNVTVREFYLRPGAYLGNPFVQQNYTSINYSQVVAELVALGVNVIAQLVSAEDDANGRYSLSSNPEITLDLLPRLEDARRSGGRVAMVGEVNRELPYMHGDAEVDAERFDFVLDDPAGAYPLFPLPNRPVLPADFATGMHVASLVRDGGTLQVGIGSLSDAVAHCLKLRHENPEVFANVLEKLPGGSRSERRRALPVETGPFREGLFASTELLSDAVFSLYESGIVRRPADDDDSAVIHAGFFIGSSMLYERLRNLGNNERQLVRMLPISHVNTLFGDESRKRRQRREARFVNETMMVTLLGAAVSDGLDDGQVVSGVGGQFDFVSMAHDLQGAQSILMCRARRIDKGVARSNFRWTYPHTTVPRHHRDVYVSEYGVAATRGRTDAEVIDAMLSIADSAFQPQLAESALRARKLPDGYAIAGEARRNTPASIRQVFAESGIAPYFPTYPLGTDFTVEEQRLVAALSWLRERTARPISKAKTTAAAVFGRTARDFDAELARMELATPQILGERILARLVSHALEQSQS
mgnify:CR=1 FL=1